MRLEEICSDEPNKKLDKTDLNESGMYSQKVNKTCCLGGGKSLSYVNGFLALSSLFQYTHFTSSPSAISWQTFSDTILD